MVAEMGWCEKLSMGCSAFDVHLELLNWAIVKNCPWNEDMCGNTFMTGHHLQSFCCYAFLLCLFAWFIAV